jgi:hypothetical protein
MLCIVVCRCHESLITFFPPTASLNFQSSLFASVNAASQVAASADEACVLGAALRPPHQMRVVLLPQQPPGCALVLHPIVLQWAQRWLLN